MGKIGQTLIKLQNGAEIPNACYGWPEIFKCLSLLIQSLLLNVNCMRRVHWTTEMDSFRPGVLCLSCAKLVLNETVIASLFSGKCVGGVYKVHLKTSTKQTEGHQL